MKKERESVIAVIDTETNWENKVMSIGVVTAEESSLKPVDFAYYILTPEYLTEGMYSDRMDLVPPENTRICSRGEAMGELCTWLQSRGIREIFAYNARFDWGHLTELHGFDWYDIMRIAAYRQHNDRIPQWEECCSTGRLKRHYGVEPILQCLRGEPGYRETHNALLDARDELQIMELLGRPLFVYYQEAKV